MGGIGRSKRLNNRSGASTGIQDDSVVVQATGSGHAEVLGYGAEIVPATMVRLETSATSFDVVLDSRHAAIHRAAELQLLSLITTR